MKPTDQQIAAAIIAYDLALEGREPITANRIEAMRLALEAAFYAAEGAAK